VKNLGHLLYDVTLQNSGFTLEDPSTFSQRILKLIDIGLGVETEVESVPEIIESETTIMEATTMEEVD